MPAKIADLQRIAAPLLAALLAGLTFPAPALAEESDAIAIADAEVELGADTFPAPTGSDRLLPPSAFDRATVGGTAAFGPFRVIDPTRAALVGATDSVSPRDFARLLRAFPQVRTLEMIECPGTSDDTANLRLGRMIRHAGIATEVPDHGSVRSGAVELFLAGTRRTAAPGAEFAVHAWQDADGLEPRDFPASDPVNRAYLSYYREMGLSEAQAAAFYAMTNAVPHDDARWMDVAEFAAYAPLD